MQANNIWAGNDYAWRGGSGRGERFSLSCERVRVRRVVKETLTGNTKSSTFVVVQFIDRDSGEVLEAPKRWVEVTRVDGENLFKVRAFDVIENWDNVADEYQHLISKQKRDQAEREQREREARELREREQQERQQRLDRVRHYLIACGIHEEWIEAIALDTTSYYDKGGVRLSFAKVEAAMQEDNEKVVRLSSAS